MSKQTEALKLALEALEEIESYYGYDRSVGAMASSMYEASNLAKITSTRIREALAEQPAQQQEPVAWTDLLKKADEIVRGKIVWKRFIDGTPLANDIAVWMADFAQQHTSPQPPQRKPLTDEQIEQCMKQAYATVQGRNLEHAFARAIEAAHGITGETK